MKRSMHRVAVGALTALVMMPAGAHEAGTWILRAGVGTVDPKSDNLDLGSAQLAGGISLSSAQVEVDSGTSLTLTGTYMFTENWAFDVLASWPFKHDIDVAATISDGTTTASGTIPLGETEHLPPTFSVQYHFLPDGVFQPYAGAGLNYTTFFSEEVSGDARAAGVTNLSLDDSFGLALQVGADWMLNDSWSINLDIRWIDIETDATLTIDDGTGPESGDIGKVEIDPWVYSLNIGYRF